MQRYKFRRPIVQAAAVIAFAPLPLLAQSSGSYIFNGDGFWGEAFKWSPLVPNDGGVGTFTQHTQQGASRTVTLNIPVALDTLVMDSTFAWMIPVTGANSLTMTGNARIDVPRAPVGTPTL